MVASLLFVHGVRLSTLIALAAYVIAAAVTRDRKVLFAGWAWLTGFEACFQATALALGHPLPVGIDGPIFYVALGAVTVPWLTAHGIRPSLPVMSIVVAIWVIWVALGFHVNLHDQPTVGPGAEAFNEAAKTLWALAYLWPCVGRRPMGGHLGVHEAPMHRPTADNG